MHAEAAYKISGKVSRSLITKPHLMLAFIWAAAVVISVSTSVGIIALQRQADEQRACEYDLLRLSNTVERLNDITSDQLDGSYVRPNFPHLSDFARSQAYSDLSRARSIDRADNTDLMNIRVRLDSYMMASSQAAALVSSGRRSEALAAKTASVDPAFARLNESLRLASEQFNEEAESAHDIAEFGTAIILILGALVAALVFHQLVISQQKATRISVEKQMLQLSESRFRSLISNTTDVISIVDATGIVKYMSPNCLSQWGYDPALVVGTCVFDSLHDEDVIRFRVMLDQAISKPGESIHSQFLIPYADGTKHLSENILTNMIDDPAVGGVICTARDISQRNAFEEQLAHQAFHDALTGLANRPLFLQRLDHSMTRATRDGRCVGVIFLDIDNFKNINDSMGHQAGDMVLMSVAERLRACIRIDDTVARLGGDEFTLLLEDIDDEQVAAVAERISAVLRTPINIHGRDVYALASLGIAICKDDRYAKSEELLRDADTAMYQAKSAGKAKTVVFDSSMNTHAIEKFELETGLRDALVKNEIYLEYQPIVKLSHFKIVEVEALARWLHPSLGLISPASFIPVAEETGLIVDIGHWVLEHACREAYIWNLNATSDSPIVVSVNVSTKELDQPDYVERTAEILRSTGLSPHLLKLEITESGMLLQPEVTLPKLNELKALGIKLAVDDFGTGYSSMSYLSNLPIDTLKIDRSFIDKMNKRRDDEAIVRAIVSLAQTLDLCITSEGIETKEQLEQLQALGCNQGQGYLFARPMRADAMTRLINDEVSLRAKPVYRPDVRLAEAA